MAQSATGGTSSRRQMRDHDSTSLASTRFVDSECEVTETIRQRELEEARARAAQMEKTMRWWSDCTANWREKWSKVRNERNKAREEAKQLRSKLDVALKDMDIYKKDKLDLELQNASLKREIERIHILLLKHAGQLDTHIFEALGEEYSSIVRENGIDYKDSEQVHSLPTEEQGAIPKYSDNCEENSRVQKACKKELDCDSLLEKFLTVQLRLEESEKTVQNEKDDKEHLHLLVEKMSAELVDIKGKCEEFREGRQEAIRELHAQQDQHREELRLVKCNLQEETNSRDGMDRRINDLRAELEKLQTENAIEWGKRERLESEKIALERENKKLRAELVDCQEHIDRKGRPLANCDAELRHLQQELADKNKENLEIKHNQNKIKKMLHDKITENSHATRRAEQYEAEVKKLRGRVEELKRDLALAEDDIDCANNTIRKLQRNNNELKEHVDHCHVHQLDHINSSDEILNNEEGGEEMATFDDCMAADQTIETYFKIIDD